MTTARWPRSSLRLLGLCLILLVAAVGLLLVQNRRGQVAGSRSETPTSSSSTAITGTLVDPPGESKPALSVCAIELETLERQCVDVGTRREYELSLSPGQYHVIAQVTGRSRQATYTNRGLCANCQLQPVVVTLAAGQRIEDVNPTDWAFTQVGTPSESE